MYHLRYKDTLTFSYKKENKLFGTKTLDFLQTSVYNTHCSKHIATKSYFKGVLIIGNLSRVRKAQGLSQEQLSKLSGISRVTISRIESGKESPKIRTLLTLSRVLKVPLADIVEKAG